MQKKKKKRKKNPREKIVPFKQSSLIFPRIFIYTYRKKEEKINFAYLNFNFVIV